MTQSIEALICSCKFARITWYFKCCCFKSTFLLNMVRPSLKTLLTSLMLARLVISNKKKGETTNYSLWLIVLYQAINFNQRTNVVEAGRNRELSRCSLINWKKKSHLKKPWIFPLLLYLNRCSAWSAFTLVSTLSLTFVLKVFMEENVTIYLPAVLPSVSAAHGYTRIILPLYRFEWQKHNQDVTDTK